MAGNPLDHATLNFMKFNTRKMPALQAITEMFVLSFGLCLCNCSHLLGFNIIYFGLVIEVQYPCIRAIVIKASKIKVGSLFIVTYTGGTIGR